MMGRSPGHVKSSGVVSDTKHNLQLLQDILGILGVDIDLEDEDAALVALRKFKTDVDTDLVSLRGEGLELKGSIIGDMVGLIDKLAGKGKTSLRKQLRKHRTYLLKTVAGHTKTVRKVNNLRRRLGNELPREALVAPMFLLPHNRLETVFNNDGTVHSVASELDKLSSDVKVILDQPTIGKISRFLVW